MREAPASIDLTELPPGPDHPALRHTLTPPRGYPHLIDTREILSESVFPEAVTRRLLQFDPRAPRPIPTSVAPNDTGPKGGRRGGRAQEIRSRPAMDAFWRAIAADGIPLEVAALVWPDSPRAQAYREARAQSAKVAADATA